MASALLLGIKCDGKGPLYPLATTGLAISTSTTPKSTPQAAARASTRFLIGPSLNDLPQIMRYKLPLPWLPAEGERIRDRDPGLHLASCTDGKDVGLVADGRIRGCLAPTNFCSERLGAKIA
jgi:hypothetical protein